MTGAALDDDAVRQVLLGLRLASVAPVEVVAERAGLAPDTVRELLPRLAARDLVRFRDGALTGWLLTPAGRAEGERLLRADLAARGPDHESALRRAYEAFLARNTRLLEVCTDWQLKGGAAANVLNDHTDPDYDAGVVAALRALHADVAPIVEALAGLDPRFGQYGPRFRVALERVEAGDGDWFTKPLIDSYHTVWFELHENLLATLAIERSSEGQP